MSRILVISLSMIFAAISVLAQNGYIHGNGDPSTRNPVPNCGASRFYIDDSTGQLYMASQGSPCTWTSAGGGGTASTILSQIPTNGLIGLYTHIDCSNPYKDYSGNGNDGTNASPILEPACAANGLSYYNASVSVPDAWQLPSSVASAGLTYVFSVVPNMAISNGYATESILASSSATGGELNLYGNNLGGAQAAQAWIPGMGLRSSQKTYTTSVIPAGSTLSFYVGSNASTDKDTIFVNGAEVPYGAQSATTLAAFAVGNLQIGGNAKPFFGTESVTAVYNRKLSTAEQQQIAGVLNNYTNTRTGLVYPKPQDLTTANRIIADGDSITVGQGVPNSWATTSLFSLGSIPFTITHQSAVSGRKLAAQQARQQQDVIPLYSANAPTNTVYLFAGTNDIAGGVTAADTWTFATNAIRKARWGNAKVVWMPMLSRTGLDTGKDSLDALVNSQCALYADYCIAPDDPQLYADGASSNPACFQGDGTHPTVACQTVISTYAENAWYQLYGSTQAAPTQVSAATYTVTASDNYITATANSVITLYNCLGYSRFVAIKVMPGLTVSVKNATSAQTIDGVDHSSSALALTAGNNYTFQVVPGAPATGGCTWTIN